MSTAKVLDLPVVLEALADFGRTHGGPAPAFVTIVLIAVELQGQRICGRCGRLFRAHVIGALRGDGDDHLFWEMCAN